MVVSPNLEPSRSAATAAAFALCGIGNALFVLDVATPLGVADGIGYAPLLSASLWLPGRRWTTLAAAIYSVLIGVGHLAGHGGVGSAALVNRGLALITLWVMAYVIDQAKRPQARQPG